MFFSPVFFYVYVLFCTVVSTTLHDEQNAIICKPPIVGKKIKIRHQLDFHELITRAKEILGESNPIANISSEPDIKLHALKSSFKSSFELLEFLLDEFFVTKFTG